MIPQQVKELLAKDVKYGFAFPIPTNTLVLIPGAAIQPLGIATQWTLNEKGERVVKHQMTHNLSLSSTDRGPGKSRSINSRIMMESYSEMIYGWCLPRISHFVVAMRLKYPGVAIFISKYDDSGAYRRIAHSGTAAVQTIAVHEELACLNIRLTFGGAPNPLTWCMFSKVVADLANEISRCAEWDPKHTFNPAHPYTPKPKRFDDDIPFECRRVMAAECLHQRCPRGTIGWLFRTAKVEVALQAHAVHNLVARRKLAEVLLDHNACIASQHIKGEHNVVADYLSIVGNDERGKPHPLAYDNPDDHDLTKRFLFQLPKQVPENFCISKLPDEILSWIISILQIAEAFSIVAVSRKDATKGPIVSGGYCDYVGWSHDPFLSSLSEPERDVFMKAFLQLYGTTTWDKNGKLDRARSRPLVANTVRQAASHLAATFRDHHFDSPLHNKNGKNLRPFARLLFKSFDNTDPPKRQQSAVTPKLLRAMYTMAGAGPPATEDSIAAVTSELSIVAFFFAMRSCEITTTNQPGQTQIIHLRGITFRDVQNNKIANNCPLLQFSQTGDVNL